MRLLLGVRGDGSGEQWRAVDKRLIKERDNGS